MSRAEEDFRKISDHGSYTRISTYLRVRVHGTDDAIELRSDLDGRVLVSAQHIQGSYPFAVKPKILAV